MTQNPLTTQDVESIIANYMTKNGGTVGGFTVAQHCHNGSDSPQILPSDLLILPNIGIPFSAGNYKYSIFISPAPLESPLIIKPSNSFFSATGANTSSIQIGEPFGNTFGSVSINTSGLQGDTSLLLENTAVDTGKVSSLSLIPQEVIISTDLVSFASSTTGTFAIQLPNVPRPTPVAGMIAFQAGTFYVCKTNGTWTVLI